jgi:hypothetical protein
MIYKKKDNVSDIFFAKFIEKDNLLEIDQNVKLPIKYRLEGLRVFKVYQHFVFYIKSKNPLILNKYLFADSTTL